MRHARPDTPRDANRTGALEPLGFAVRRVECDALSMRRLPQPLVDFLSILRVVAVVTVARSVLFGRWTTVLFAVLLAVGARAALRERTWGVGLVLASGTAFFGAACLGFAPPWFAWVGLLSAVPFVLTVKPMLRFDVGATGLFLASAIGSGIGAAYAWRELAYATFWRLPHWG